MPSTYTLCSSPSNLARAAYDPAADLAIRVVANTAAFRALKDEWSQLYRRCERPRPFNSWDWLYSWWQSYGEARQLRILTYRRSGVLTAAVPLYLGVERGALGWPMRVMRFLGDGSFDSDYLTWLAGAEDETVLASSLVAWLDANTEWDALVLREMPAECKIPALLPSAAAEAGWLVREEHGRSGVLDLPPNLDEFLQARQARFKTKLRSLLKKLDKGELVFESATPSRALATKLRSLFKLHQARWQAAGQPGVFGDRSKQLFYSRFAPRFRHNNWLRLYSLRTGSRYLAHQLCFEEHGITYLLQEGFDTADTAASYGQMLRAAVIRHLIDLGIRRYDFLGGYSRHKEIWGAQEQAILHLVIARKSLRGTVYFHWPELRERCAAAAKRLLPPSVRERLRRAVASRQVAP